MSEAIQATGTRDISSMLLAKRELLSLKKATSYLVTRVRTKTPLDAAEFLAMCVFDEKGRGAYDERAQIALKVMVLYRELFPREYAASQSPPFSTQREQEFYLLADSRLFPMGADEITDPRFFWPFIPVRGTQQHNWVEGCCAFDKLQTVFRLVLVLAKHHLLEGRHFEAYRTLGLSREPAPPLGPLAWAHFVYSCAVELTPLRYLPLAFNMVYYKTGNVWLDVPRGASFGYDWSAENVAKLFLERRQADEINSRVLELNQWLVEDPAERIGRALELWNAAAEMAAMEGEG